MLNLHHFKNAITSSVVGSLFFAASAALHASVLQNIGFAELPGDRFEIRLDFDSLPEAPAGYTIEQPARIVLDFKGVENALPEKKYPLSFENARSAVVLSGGERTRLILNMMELDPYVTRTEGNSLFVEVGVAGGGQTIASSAPSSVEQAAVSREATSDLGVGIGNVDFRRGEDGEGKILIDLSSPSVDVDVEKRGDNVVVSFSGVELPPKLRRNLDVVDFATPVSLIRADQDGDKAVFEIKAFGDYDYLAYQADNQYVVSIKPMTEAEVEERKSRFSYVGDKLSLNFQNIEVRSVLQLIADFTELNLVASDTVTGSITLRLDNVPWDQALELVLKTKGLDKRQVGNVLMVAPAAEIAERERQEIETKKQLEELAPLQTEYIRIRYANARELFDLFNVDDDDGADDDGTSTKSILSERGSAIVDERTNSIILTDTAEKISAFRKLVDQIDIPIRQVMIEARIVIADTDFKKELGVRIAGDFATSSKNGKHKYEATGRLEGLVNGDGGGPEEVFRDTDGDGISDDERNLTDSNLVDLGVADAFGAISWNIITDNVLLGIELSALQENGLGEIVSQPKVITGDKQEAHIQSGTEIPYLEASASGATSTSFKEAVLELRVTPQITPDDHIIMDVSINKDSVSSVTVGDIPAIDVTELDTQVLVGDGQTVVLGGIYETAVVEGESKVPFLGDLPYLGRLFRKDIKDEEKSELLIFITPKILTDGLIK